MTTTELDQAKTQAFTRQVLEYNNGGRLAIMLCLGDRTGLFETMAGLSPATSAEVAAAAGLNERYVREWLGSMVTGGVVNYDAAAKRYHLPAEHALVLTRAGGLRSMTPLMHGILLMAGVFEPIVSCFRAGGGVPYSAYAGANRMAADISNRVFDANLIDRTLPLVAGLPERLTAGIDIADIGCGSGHAVNLMARQYPASRFTGYDFSEEAIATARAEATAWGLTNARFEQQDVAALDLTGTHDLITAFDTIHDQAKPRQVLANIARALRPGGALLMVDIGASSNLEENLDHPLAPGMYANSTMICLAMSLGQDGEGLGAMWGEQQARELLAEAGFTSVEVQRVEGDILNNYYVARAG